MANGAGKRASYHTCVSAMYCIWICVDKSTLLCHSGNFMELIIEICYCEASPYLHEKLHFVKCDFFPPPQQPNIFYGESQHS